MTDTNQQEYAHCKQSLEEVTDRPDNNFLNVYWFGQNNTFLFISKEVTYIATATGEHLDRPEDKPYKNNVIYEAYFIDPITNIPKFVCFGREAVVTGKIMAHYIDNFMEKENG